MKTYKCLKCDTDIHELNGNDPKDKDSQKMWNGGAVFNIITGYGSSHDGGMFTGALCDKCIDIMTQIGTLKYLGDYIFGGAVYKPLNGETND